ncbi:testis-specific gene 10 protein-like isoform X3 [Pomacea canaliculata]|uniref:testis-specific gene 10 protein-like isoform X3 n=1 Tax=Pomacea canaliculata TaxID=400727 RepID=UPI000D727004|nr:testis-specific gene 10 protein-like isoform X3 [Pomacea canaliculata]
MYACKKGKTHSNVEARDEEIDRLTKMLDGGRPSDVVSLDAKNRANERMISHLNIQVDFLQQKNRDLERKLSDYRLSAEDAESRLVKSVARNRELEMELKGVDRMAKKLQTDKDVVVRAADREMGEAKEELEKSRHELEDLDMQIAQLKAENSRLAKDYADMKARLTVREADTLKLEDLLDRLQEEKKRLIQRANKLTANEKELVLEIERLKRKNGPSTKKGKIPSKLDAFIRGIEEEREYYRQQADALQRMLRGEPPRSSSPIRSRPSSRSGSPVRERPDKKMVAQHEAIVRVLEEEKEYYKKEYETLKALKRSVTPSRLTPTKSVAEESELLRLTRERDELKNLLDKFERHMAEIQANVKVLTAERDKLNNMYEETKEELMLVRRELIASPKSPKTSLAAQAILRRVENERDDAISDLRRMTTERDSLRERIKIATESSLSDRAKLEQRVEDLESTLHTVQAERDELLVRVANLKEDVKCMEDQVKDQALRLNQMDEDSSRQKTSAMQLKMIVEETEKSLADTQQRLLRREKELQAQEERAISLEDQLTSAQRMAAVQRDEMSAMRTTLAAVDREKDALQIAVDEKTEKVAYLNAELHDKERIISDLKVRVGELEAQLQHANDNLSLKDREVKSLRRQLDGTNEDLQETSRSRDIAMRENRRLQDDLTVMSKENQKLNGELQDTLEEREILKTQAQQYILEVRRVEDLLATKEQERSDLLDQYRKLSMEAEQYQTTSHQLESEGSNLRLELMTKESELRRMHDKIDNLEREIEEHVHAQQSYEQQVISLTRSVTTLEENLRQTEDEKAVLRADYTAARENAAQLDALKEQLQRKLTAMHLDKEQLQSLVEDLRQESELLQSQLSQERATVKNLEALLQTNREKEFQGQLLSQERNTEIQMLKDRLSLNDSKTQSQSREIASLRTRNVELEGDVERLRRQLSNEKFERDRAVQELRRNGIAPPLTLSEYSGEHLPRSLSRERTLPRSRSRSRSLSPPPRYRNSPNTSFAASVRQRSPDRSYLDSDYLDTMPKTYGHDVL